MGRLEDGVLLVTPNEISRMTKKYVLMYGNRQTYIAAHNKSVHKNAAETKGKLGEKFKYTPGVSNKNKALGRKATLKSNPFAESMSIEDRLI
jgi:hypothetical protein